MKWRSVGLVTIQFACIACLAVTGPVLPTGLVSLVLEAGGLVLMMWAMLSIGVRRVRAMPDVTEETRLVTHGPFRFIRHPMYTAGFLIVLPWVFAKPTPVRITVLAILVVNMIVKMSFEERQLRARFPEYEPYSKRTKRVIPWVW